MSKLANSLPNPDGGLSDSRRGLSVMYVADAMLKMEKIFTPMKLLKLAYITHGFTLAIRGNPLFYNDIEAWDLGPVIPDLYHGIKLFRSNKIPFNYVSDEPLESLLRNEKTLDIAEEVVSKYGDLSGIQLSTLTHQEGTPWHQVYKRGRYHIKIPNDIIKEHYRSMLIN